MRFIDYILLALRNITRQKLRSVLTVFAVVIGATSVTIMLALVFGAKNFFLQQMNANGTLQQIGISKRADIANFDEISRGGNQCDDCVKLTDELAAKIAKLPHIVAVSRQQGVWGFEAVEYNGKKYTLEQVKAYDEGKVLHDSLVAGRNLSDADKDSVVVITADYADKFGFKGAYDQLVGKQIVLQSQKGYTGVGAQIPKPVPGSDYRIDEMPATRLKATVVGVIDTSSSRATVRVPMDWARQMTTQRYWQVTEEDARLNAAECGKRTTACNNMNHMTLVTQYDSVARNGYDSLTAKVDDIKNAKQAVKDIKEFGVGAADAESFIKQQLQIFNIMGYILGGIGGISLAVAAVGVVNTMVMAILERTREIGVMRAVGARRATIRRLFTFEAALLGFFGGIFGLLVGYGLVMLANPLINKQLSENGIKAENIIGIPIWLLFAVVGITTLIGMLAGLYPAARAAKLDPVDALHYE
jgi:ABC-type antimicrobial peptide transport system permease subunit